MSIYLNLLYRLPGTAVNIIKIGVGKSIALKHLKIGFNPMEPDNALNLLKSCQISETIQILDLDGVQVNKDFVQLKSRLEETRGMTIIIEGCLSSYEIKGPNIKEMMLRRARFEGFKPKKKKRKRDFGSVI